MQKIILFDLDGTLIDSTPAILASFYYAFEKLSLTKPSQSDIKQLIGFPLDEMFIQLTQRKDLAQLFISTYRSRYKEIYLEQTTLLPLVKEALSLACGFSDLAIVSTKGSAFISPLLEHLGIRNFFKAIIGREDVDKPKPSAQPILKALSALNKDKENAFMIGDTKLDIMAARAARIEIVAISCGYESENELKEYTDIIKTNVYEAVKFIQTL
ncbi:HAD family hydrolase [Campylobacter sp. LR291e]|uniref:HAD family hydrolase n=1 Tax=unclassified Campylobacter TaxID=2593542 RepID=UPI001237CD2B|nr:MULTISPECIES: HAD family hydrolase [unclassified Campylobacter]KAA6226070.1 HAD family hydrolase [Campylobacter sp. LR185c]KAA6231482.1 HAD family hydrolase [Campylobacter sp. LR291e]KAA8604572.1 hydrolase [Campylobacter sp. LR185c]